jgi:hypothetical protein
MFFDLFEIPLRRPFGLLCLGGYAEPCSRFLSAVL